MHQLLYLKLNLKIEYLRANDQTYHKILEGYIHRFNHKDLNNPSYLLNLLSNEYPSKYFKL